MASGPLRFQTPHIEEIPTAQVKQAPGFAWVAVTGPQEDPSKNWGADKPKRARTSLQGNQTEAQREALSTRQQREIDRRLKELNSDGSRDVRIPNSKSGNTGPRAGKTSNTKKILASGKTFAHYLDDEEAEIVRTGKRDGDLDVFDPKAPLVVSGDAMDCDDDSGGAAISQAELQALLDLPPLTYSQARSAPPPANAPPARRFCRVCGYFERAKCPKCSASYCSVACKDTHDADQCLKFYA